MEEKQGVRVTVSVSRKINLGNYESADIFLAVSNVPTDLSDEELQREVDLALDTGEKLYEHVRSQVVKATEEIKQRRLSQD